MSEPAPSPSSEEAKSGCEPRCELRSRTDPMPPASLPPTQDAHASIHSLKTPQRTCKMPSARAAQAKRNFELGAPVHTRVWPFLGAAPAARRGFLDFCGNRSAWFLNAVFLMPATHCTTNEHNPLSLLSQPVSKLKVRTYNERFLRIPSRIRLERCHNDCQL